MPELTEILKRSRAEAVAVLSRLLGDLFEAEDAVSEAVLQALQIWPEQGMPRNPTAWLLTTARRRAIDRFRHGRFEAAGDDPFSELSEQAPDGNLSPFRDDLFRLIFTCCHAELSQEIQVMLALKVVAGLSVPEIARAFLVQPRAMEQRLTRAKRLIKERNLEIDLPESTVLANRRVAVRTVIYTIFTTGHHASQRPELVDKDLCLEALFLGDLLCDLFPEDSETTSLAALMRFGLARSAARLDDSDQIVPLDEQDRSRWDQNLIAEGRHLLAIVNPTAPAGPVQLQAAISALHCEASSWLATDWPAILALFDALLMWDSGPVVRLNRAVAQSFVETPKAALAEVEKLAEDQRMLCYQPYYAAKADLLLRNGDAELAREAFVEALHLTSNPQETAWLRARIARSS